MLDSRAVGEGSERASPRHIARPPQQPARAKSVRAHGRKPMTEEIA
jgi:hypothetical protein